MPRDKRTFYVSVERDDAGFYFGRCRELPNAFTQAKTLDELKQRMSEVIDLILEDIEEAALRGVQGIQLLSAKHTE